MRNKSLKLALAASAVLTLAACSASPGGGAGGGEGAAAPSYEVTANTPAPTGELDKLTWSTYAEPFSLDYAYAFDYADNQILSNVCESLVRLNDDMSISPGLATKYENPTPKTWVYTIREGVKFHDGTTLTADDVVASMNRHLDPKIGSFWFSVYQNVESIKKTGPNEVTVTSKIPDALFNESMSGAAGVIGNAATMAKLGAEYGNSKGGVNCTGPFELKKWQSGEKLSLTRFDGLLGQGPEGQGQGTRLRGHDRPGGTRQRDEVGRSRRRMAGSNQRREGAGRLGCRQGSLRDEHRSAVAGCLEP